MDTENSVIGIARVLLPSKDLPADMAFFKELGFRLDNIFPADNPAVAIMSGHGLSIRLDKNSNGPASEIHILTDQAEIIGKGEESFVAPNGTIVKIKPESNQVITPSTRHKFEVRHMEGNTPWVIGRAGMLYRDLIPDRLGGGIIASHIRIPNGGPVPDMVHYHTIGFQLIFCIRGWVRLVYEDQGPPFILHAGDCVTQPPEIRHRVLEASDNLEVIEIGVPAEHMTTIDHEMELPTKTYRPDREFQGQRFCHHQMKDAVWKAWRIPGFEFRDTGISKTSAGVASVHVARPLKKGIHSGKILHNVDILFTFVKNGEVILLAEGHNQHILRKGDAFVIPPQLEYELRDCSADLELIEVALP